MPTVWSGSAHPFNSSELPAELKKWKASKGPRLSDAWAPKNGDVFIDNYFTLCEGFVRAKWRAQVSAPAPAVEGDDKAQAEVAERPSDAFVFDPTKAHATPANRIQAEFNAALMFFLREVLSEDILARVIHIYNSEEEPRSITWAQMLKVIKANQPQPDSIELLVDLVSRKRASSESARVVQSFIPYATCDGQ